MPLWLMPLWLMPLWLPLLRLLALWLPLLWLPFIWPPAGCGRRRSVGPLGLELRLGPLVLPPSRLVRRWPTRRRRWVTRHWPTWCWLARHGLALCWLAGHWLGVRLTVRQLGRPLDRYWLHWRR